MINVIIIIESIIRAPLVEIAKNVFVIFDNLFHAYLMSGLKTYEKKNSQWLFFKSTLSGLRCTWTGRINLKIFLGYHISYRSIWPFMCHPWFPTRKASKWTFVCFHHQVLNTLQGLDNWSWKQTNVSFEAFLWKIKFDI